MKKIIKQCEQLNDIFIYGAGALSNILYLFLKSYGFENEIKGFLVSNTEGNPTQKYGKPVMKADRSNCSGDKCIILIATQSITHKTICKHLRVLGCENFTCIDENVLLNEFYNILYEKPIQNNKIIFMNMKGMGYGGNPKYIADKLLKNKKNISLDLVWVISEETYEIPKEIRTVKMGSIEYYQEIATARIWIDNTRKTSDIQKREGQFYLQTWHGAAPIKKVEKDVADKLPKTYEINAKHDSQMADLFLSGSKFYSQLYRRAFWYDGDIMEVGLPRQDVFWRGREIKRKVYQYYGIKENIGFVLYAPTFRRDFSMKYYDLDIQRTVSALEDRFKKKFVCGISKHPDIRNKKYFFDEKCEYLKVDAYEDFEELLMAADILITDYSGCMYDFLFTKKPVFLYQKDYEEYLKDRNFYIPMEKLPYIQAFSNQQLEKEIRDFDMIEYQKKVELFLKEMGNFDNGTASEKVAEMLLNLIEKK